jgi:hypothetical protein
LGRWVKENFRLPCDSVGVEYLRLVAIYFEDLDIQRFFSTTFGTDKKARRVYAAFHLFSAKNFGAMQTNMNMEE